MRLPPIATASVIIALLAVSGALAHVGYVVGKNEAAQAMGNDPNFLLAALQPFNIALMLGTLVLAVLAWIGLPRITWLRKKAAEVRKRAESYEEFLPWIARLGLGIALIGSGTSGTLLTPSHPTTSAIAIVEILLGFLLLAGALTGPAAIATGLIYIFALAQDTYMFGNLDMLALTLLLLAIGSGRPGLDDLYRIPSFVRFDQQWRTHAPIILRLGIGLAFIYLAVHEKLLNPHLSAIVVQNYGLQSAIPVSDAMWVLSAGLIELAVGLALLFGLRTRISAAVAFIVLSMSFFYFNEAVYSHITLFATLSALFITGGGNWSLDAWLERQQGKNAKSRSSRT